MHAKTLTTLTIAVLLIPVAVCHARTDNTVTFDNQSGQPALVKLVGPTPREVEVPIGQKRTVTASSGQYHIKTRYGSPGKYRYTKGDEFVIKDSATNRSKITITLHKVVDGNYDSRPISAEDFGSSGSVSKGPPAAATQTPIRQDKGHRKADILQLFYQKPNPYGISNVLRLRGGKEGDLTHVLLAVPPESGKVITTYYGHDEKLLVFDSKTGKPVVNRTNVQHEVTIQLGDESFTGTASGPIPVVSPDVPKDSIQEVKTVAGMTVGMANCLEIKALDGNVVPYMAVFDDSGHLVITHCVNRQPDPDYRLIPCTVSGKGLTTTTKLPSTVTLVKEIGAY